MLISILWYPPCWTLNMKFPAIFSRLVVRERSARGNTNQTTTLKHGILLLRYGVRKIQRLIDLSCLCVNARKRANHLSWKVTRITLDEWFIILRVYLHKRTYDFFVTLIRGNFFDVILKFLGVQRIWYIRLDGLSIPNINSPFAPSINAMCSLYIKARRCNWWENSFTFLSLHAVNTLERDCRMQINFVTAKLLCSNFAVTKPGSHL